MLHLTHTQTGVVCTYVTDLLLSPSESLHLRSVGHDAEAAAFTLLKVLLVLHLQEAQAPSYHIQPQRSRDAVYMWRRKRKKNAPTGAEDGPECIAAYIAKRSCRWLQA